MARLIRIGNSHGVKIPKSLVRQAGLGGRELEITAGEDGVWIRPLRHRREGWEQALAELGQTGNDEDLLPDLGASSFDKTEWDWPQPAFLIAWRGKVKVRERPVSTRRAPLGARRRT